MALSDIKKMSVSNFISDIPRLFNNAIESITNTISTFINEDENKIKAGSIEAANITATSTVICNNIIISDDKIDVLSTLKMMQDEIDDLKKQIDENTNGE